MIVSVGFTTGRTEPAAVQGATAVVIDVVRATTTVVEALAHGARGIFPTTSIEEAVKLASSLGREDTLLCGERKGIKIDGFDLGNSPLEFTADVVAGKRLVMSTTNGTPAFSAVQEADRVLACSFTNLSAVARSVVGADRLVIQCAGRQDRFSLDDAACAGHLLRRVLQGAPDDVVLDDAARAALTLAEGIEPSREFLSETAAGRALIAIDLGADLEVCAQMDRHAIVPEMHDQALVLAT